MMKKLLKHALLICAGLSAGALYAPDNTHLTIGDLRQMVQNYHASLSQSWALKFTPQKQTKVVRALTQGSSLCQKFRQPPTLKNLYQAVCVAKHQHTQPNPVGYRSALYVIGRRARKEGITININLETDLTQENVNNINWWKCNYIGIVNSYPSFTDNHQKKKVNNALRTLLSQTDHANLLVSQARADYDSKGTNTQIFPGGPTILRFREAQATPLSILDWCFDHAKKNGKDLGTGLTPDYPQKNDPPAPRSTLLPQFLVSSSSLPESVSSPEKREQYDDGKPILPQNQYWLNPDALAARLNARLNLTMNNFELYFEEWRKKLQPKPTPEPPAKRQRTGGG